MKTQLSLSLLPLVLLTFGATAQSLSINIVSNGDFETFHSSNPFFPPWQFSHGFNAFINEPTMVASGLNCVFIGGLSGGDMWQDLSTVVGQPYQFTFYERGDDLGQTERISLLNVSFGDQVVGSYTDDNKISGWNYHTFTVIADSTITRLDFQQASSSIGSFGYPGVDGVSVNAIPEPSTLNLVGTVLLISFGNRVRVRMRSRYGCHAQDI
jgi:hypothetical protein